VLKNVKLLVLMDKTINLPIEKKLMYRLLLLIVVGGLLAITGCKKDDGVYGPSQVKAQAAIDEQLIQQYMAANNLTGKFTKGINKPDSTGLWYMITKDTTTTTLYSSSSLITVGYTGRIIPSGNVFIQTGDIHPAFTLSQIIKGWSICLPKCKKGGSIRILMASRYAYGPYAQPNIGKTGLPANAVLDFEISVYDVAN
jgi:FKBP-type peptidyl-prolyl cis-trans isomerase FkpA